MASSERFCVRFERSLLQLLGMAQLSQYIIARAEYFCKKVPENPSLVYIANAQAVQCQQHHWAHFMQSASIRKMNGARWGQWDLQLQSSLLKSGKAQKSKGDIRNSRDGPTKRSGKELRRSVSIHIVEPSRVSLVHDDSSL